MADVSLFFSWAMYRPDQRQYRQQSIELYPRINLYADDNFGIPPLVEVKIPLGHELIANSQAIITAQLGSGEAAPAPILTIQGMKYVQDQFDAVLDAATNKPAIEEDDWGTEEATGGPATTTDSEWGSSSVGEWDEATQDDKNVPWKEDWGT